MGLHDHVQRREDRNDCTDDEENCIHRSTSSKYCDEQCSEQQVYECERKQKSPGKAHELVIAKTRQSAAHPDEGEQQKASFGCKPPQRDQNEMKLRHRPERSQHEHSEAEYGKGFAIARACRVCGEIKECQRGNEETQRREIIGKKPGE